ncbi:MAG: thiamine pyrophosphate-dependent enzyme [Candidatus Heimdallarchaeota archaeon]
MAKVKTVDIIEAPDVLLKGNFACTGCGLSIAYKTAVSAVPNPIVVIPACCASVIQSPHPNVTYNVPIMNIAFAAHAAIASGIARAKKVRGDKNTVLVWSGDGGTYDIGMATVSGAAERNENIIHVCYDNGFYGNTGEQRSGATPRGATTTTTPFGKNEKRKSIARVIAAHDVPYVVATSVGYPRDIHAKLKKAATIEGFKFVLIDSPCPTGWRSDPALTVELGKLSVKTGFFPMYEIEDGVLKFHPISRNLKDPSKRTPLEDYLNKQGRFKKITPTQIESLKADIQKEWEALMKLEG